MDYAVECQAGRDHAAQIIQEAALTGNLPNFAQAIREAAKDESGYGAGFLFAIGAALKQTPN